MRPLRLTMKGFTAFRDEQEVDFTDLDVFAISGPTGSGKSSLLDAMTFALYGRVERVGDRVSQLVSQGQPAMAVTFEFEVGRDGYRVTRRTPSKGASKIMLERRSPDGAWEQAGEGADRVREAGPIIQRAIGLTYDGFTRSVLLPQGKFSEFLVGDPAKRRDILTELLGLSLFKRMAERAGAIGREAAVRSETMSGMVERDYADATPDALLAARAAARAAKGRTAALDEAADRVAAIVAQWDDARRSMDDLRSCAQEASAAARAAEGAAGELEALATALLAADHEVRARTEAAGAAQQALDAARTALARDEASCGSAADLADGRLAAHRLAETSAGRIAAAEALAEADRSAGSLDATLEAATATVTEAAAERDRRRTEAEAAEAAVEQARHADLVGAVSAGLAVGDPCPVCGEPLARAPARPPAKGLIRATEALAAARDVLDEAGRRVDEVSRAAEHAANEVQANARERARLTEEVARLDGAVGVHAESLRGLLGDPLPDDVVAEIERRLADRDGLDRAEREAARSAADAAQALARAGQERERIVARIHVQRERLGADHRPLTERVVRALGDGRRVGVPPRPPEDAGDDPAALREHAEVVARALEDLAGSLAAAVDERAALEASLVAELAATVGDLVEASTTVDGFARAVDGARREAAAAVATTNQRAKDLATRVERKRALLEEVKLLDERAGLFKQLALELRADRLIAYLQAEALQLLAAAGSERLQALSDGRYGLVCRDDEFLVVDTWNADEERSVRTLSGGETFLASLALALALADQVRSLSTTDRARLDSLFLDEGFGTLDQETLRTVVDAIGQLAQDGRMVGVITHVRDLAEEFPRIEVEKSPTGSRLRLVPA